MTNVHSMYEGVDRREAWATASSDDSVIIKNEALHLLSKIAAWQIILFIVTGISVAGFFFIAIGVNDDAIQANAAAIKANTVAISSDRSIAEDRYSRIEDYLKRIESKVDGRGEKRE
jgi:hypothetical protein